MTLNLRSARHEDLGALEGLLAANGLPLQGVAEHLPHFLVTEHDGSLVAAAGLELYGNSAMFRSVVVADRQKGKGVGAELVIRLVEQAGASGLHALFLLTTTAADYFPRFGFERIERTCLPQEMHASEELRGACPASAVVMRRRL